MRAKLHLAERTFTCDTCGHVADRDTNAATNIAREAERLLEHQYATVAGLRPETRNADPRLRQTGRAQARPAAAD